MGFRWFINRAKHAIALQTGIIRKKNTFQIATNFPVTIATFRSAKNNYLFNSKNAIHIPKNRNSELERIAKLALKGTIKYFNGIYFDTPQTNKWHTNPETGFTFNNTTHWLNLQEFSPDNDIKYVWERSRFCYLYDIIRYDYHFDIDCSKYVIDEILDWIKENPVHCGPNYISAQEIALRVLNWLFAIHYYKDSETLSDSTWQTIACSMYNQIKHISANLLFAQKLVRNNHVITEAAALFTFATLFPQLAESSDWERKSRKILEDECAYQIFNDGTYLQYSMNYHRVIIQVYNLVLRIADVNNTGFSDNMQSRLKKSLYFLITCTNAETGELPNYGANDGSLFFPLNNNTYSDYRPQIQALAHTLKLSYLPNTIFEDTYWMNGTDSQSFPEISSSNAVNQFPDSGYYTIRQDNSFTFIRCGNHKSRPSQADNLHIDLWYNSTNIMRDAGTYKYNTDKHTAKYFFGTTSHNALMLGDWDQMLKGPRFLWFYHSSVISSRFTETADSYIFSGTIKAFKQSGKWHKHHREIIINKLKTEWTITDTLEHSAHIPINQHWHPDATFFNSFKIIATDAHNKPILPTESIGYYSPTYGSKIACQQITFSSFTNKITTHITAIS